MPNLLDTHTFLWYVDGSDSLSDQARKAIEEVGAVNLISVASSWEIGIKFGPGKLHLPDSPERFMPLQMKLNNLIELPIGLHESCEVHLLPPHHRDPFDRLIATQCLKRNLQLISRDAIFDAYGVKRVW